MAQLFTANKIIKLIIKKKLSTIKYIMQKRVFSQNGLNIPFSQFTSIEPMAHQHILVPQTSNPTWGGYFTLDLKEKYCHIHNLTLKFNVSPITGATSGQPYYTPAWFWINRLELTINNTVIDTIYGNQQFLLHQLFNYDEKRKYLNITAGDYGSKSQRKGLASTANDYYVPLWSFFKQTHITAISPKDDVQIRVWMDTAANNIVADGAEGVLSSTINYCTLLTQVSKLQAPTIQALYKETVNKPTHYQFSELRYGTYTINAGSASTSIVLSSLVGPVSFLYFVVRPTNGRSGDGYFTYLPIKDFAILDAGSTNIVGGQAIVSSQALLHLNKDWTRSSYSSEIAVSSNNKNAYVYLYSFGASPDTTIWTGKNYNNHRFIGSEQLVINFDVALTQSVTVDLYAQVDSALEITSTYVKKLNL